MTSKVDVGSVGIQVAKNIQIARSASGLQFKQLSDMLSDAGRPIPPLGLRRIERLERRVDVQDIASIAKILGFTVEQMMFSDLHLSAKS